MPILTLNDVDFGVGGPLLLQGVDLAIEPGERIALIGRNGAGKSTLLRLLAGLDDVTRGVLRIGDEIVNEVQPQRRNVAMVFQDYALYPHLTVAENMGVSLMLAGAKRAAIAEKVRPAAEILGLSRQSLYVKLRRYGLGDLGPGVDK